MVFPFFQRADEYYARDVLRQTWQHTGDRSRVESCVGCLGGLLLWLGQWPCHGIRQGINITLACRTEAFMGNLASTVIRAT